MAWTFFGNWSEKFYHFHQCSLRLFQNEFMLDNFIGKNYTREERVVIENKLKADLERIDFSNFYNNEEKPLEKKPLEKKPLEKKPLEKKPLEKKPSNDGKSKEACKETQRYKENRCFKENYIPFCNFVESQLGIENDEAYKKYVDNASGRAAAKKLSRNVVGKIKAYHNKYHGKGPKSFVDDVIASIENYSVDENKSDNYGLFLTQKLRELENKENEYYQKRVPSCFSCFTFFYQQRSSLQPLITEAKKMVAEYKKQNESDPKHKIPPMSPKK